MKTKKKSSRRPRSNRPIALLTDFGMEDQYVSVMKGVILSINPLARIIDVTHSVDAHNVREGGYLLWSAYKYFPPETIFVCIVDPGVGSERKILCAQTQHHSFFAPDNGLLEFVLSEEKNVKTMYIDIQRAETYLRASTSVTFHGRDIFAPLAANCSLGTKMEEFGKPVEYSEGTRLFIRSRSDETVKPSILHIDHFGNIITNVFITDIAEGENGIKAVSIGRNLVSRWVRTYAEAPENTPCLIVGSNGLIEISMKNTKASAILNAQLNTQVKIYWR